jgi:hypothetical protein
MLTLNITNLYANIPNKEVIELITMELQDSDHCDVNIQNEVTELIKVTMKQNYFEFKDTVWQQENGTPMGSPIYSILAEIFLQNLETKFYPDLIRRRHIQFIARYVDDILIIYDSTKATAEDILENHSNLHPAIKCNLEVEHNGSINFLVLNLFRLTNEILFGIHHKPAYTNIVIPAASNHPMQHKLSACNHMLGRVNNLPLSVEEKSKELGIIKVIAKNNGCIAKFVLNAYNIHKRNK